MQGSNLGRPALQADSLPLVLRGKRFKRKQTMKGQTGGAAGRSREWVRMSPEDAHQGLPLTDPGEGRRKYGSLGLREARATGSLWQRTRGWMEKQTDYFTPPHPTPQSSARLKHAVHNRGPRTSPEKCLLPGGTPALNQQPLRWLEKEKDS